MGNACRCFSCSQYRKHDKFLYLKSSNTKSKNGLKIKKTPRSFHPSKGSIDHLPDDVLIHILSFISPTNIDNFITLITLEMVSKRFRHYIFNNQEIWENVTELVIGFHPNLPKDQYLCHIGHFTLELFLRRVPKITKVILNMKGCNWKMDIKNARRYAYNQIMDVKAVKIKNVTGWSCHKMVEEQICPVIERYAEKLKFSELVLYGDGTDATELLITKLFANDVKQSLESIHLNWQYNNNNITADYFDEIGPMLKKCRYLHNIKTSSYIYEDDFYFILNSLKFVEMLEISSYDELLIDSIYVALMKLSGDHIDFPLRALRFTNPTVSRGSRNISLQIISEMVSSVFQGASSIPELEIHCCSLSSDLDYLPALLGDSSDLKRLKLTFFPCFEFNKSHRIFEFLNYVHHQTYYITISLTFVHSGGDQEAKLITIIHNLLDSFQVAHKPEKENKWEFIIRKLTVHLKLEKIQDQSFICHLCPPTTDD